MTQKSRLISYELGCRAIQGQKAGFSSLRATLAKDGVSGGIELTANERDSSDF